jgi:NAD(P)-dependent dehydrogenase (short-subunit alcohol dehydrogenase family)
MHPGIVDTQLIRYVFPQGISSNKPAVFPGIRSTIIKLLGLKTPEEGASTAVFLASAPEMEGVTGGYYEDSRRKSPSARAVDSRLAYELWRVSEELTGATEALEPLKLSVLAANVLS